MDVVNDIAVLKINPGDKQLKALKMGDSEGVQVGEEVAAIGSALGYSQSFTTGVVSGTNREISYRLGGSRVEYENTIQTDAAINPGNSGGPLLNLNGEVIGVNFLKMQYVDNMGFCLPINSIQSRIAEYKEFGKFDLPFLGVKYQAVGYFDVLMDPDKVEGAEVVEVLSDSPAGKAGIEVGDIITEVEDEDVGGALNYFVQKYEVGETIEIEIYRNGEYQDVEVTLQSRHDFDLD
jgi:serine protease Do